MGTGFDAGHIARELARSRGLERNFPDRQPMTPERGWNRLASSSLLLCEAPGAPVPDGAFTRAREAMKAFAFSDPRIVVAHFDAGEPLEGRRMLLELKARSVSLLAAVRVDQVWDETTPAGSLFGFSMETLDGHIEAGREWFLLHKDAATGEIRFAIEAAWKAAHFPNFWTYAGFQLLGRRYQRAWHRLAHARLARFAGGDIGLLQELGPMQLVAVRALRPTRMSVEHERLRRDRLLLSAAFGGLSGARAASGPALLAWDARRRIPRSLVAASTAFAAFEMLADKSSWIEDRIAPTPLLMRAVSGALSGAAVAERGGRQRTGSALVGAASAVVSAGATFLLRRAAIRRLGWKAGVLEDAAVYGLGAVALARLRRDDPPPVTAPA